MKYPFKCQPLFFPKQINSKQKHCVLHLALRLETMISPSPGPWSVQPSTQAELFGKAQCFSSWNGGGSISLAVCRGDSFKTLKSKHWQNRKLFPSSLWRYFKHWSSPGKGLWDGFLVQPKSRRNLRANDFIQKQEFGTWVVCRVSLFPNMQGSRARHSLIIAYSPV